MENPFRVLGLDRDLVRRLDDATCARLVEQQYRFLQKVFHPDVGGDPRYSRLLNEAREALDLERNPDSFARYKKAYTRRAQGAVEREALKAQAGMYDRMLDNLLVFLRSRADRAGELSIYTPGPLTLLLHDKLLGRTLPPDYYGKGKSKVFFELKKSREGILTAKRSGRAPEQYEGRFLVGAVPRELEATGSHNPFARLLQQLAPKGESAGERYVALPRQAGKTLDLRRIPPELLRPLAEYFTPFLKLDSYLFSAGTDEQGLYFRLEGSINSISRE
jgi:curved DNA-binding protein CbpA